MPKLVIIGDIGLDLVLGPVDNWPAVGTEALVDRVEMRSGFSAANAALAARHLGHDCQLIGAIGDDDIGRGFRDRLAGVDARLIVMAGKPTTLTVAFVRSDGERSFLTSRGHLEQMGWGDVLAAVEPAGPGDIALVTGFFLLPSMRATFREALLQLRELGYRIAVDTGWPPEGWTAGVRAEVMAWLPMCDLLLLNEIEVRGLSEQEQIEQALASMVCQMAPHGIAVAKLGSQGAAAVHDGGVVRGAAPSLPVFDTVGAGDSFNAAFLAALQNDFSLAASLTAGCIGASSIITQFPRSAIVPGALADIIAPQAVLAETGVPR